MIYADYNGSAPLSEEVVKYLQDRIHDGPFANPNAIHCLGSKILKGMEKCRELCAEALGADSYQLTFNSGASEGISTVFHSVLGEAPKEGKDVVILSSIEHSAVINAGKFYEKKGYQVKHLPVTSDGVIYLSTLQEWLKSYEGKVALVSIMAANNETGVIQPFEDVGEMCNEHGVPYFSDTTQYIGKSSFNFKSGKMDYAVCSGHKIGALTGTGILLAKNPRTIVPLVHGGGQENGRRGGTQNYIGNETLAISLTSFIDNKGKLEEVRAAREDFEMKIKEKFPEVVIMGDKAPRLSGTTLISYPGLHGQAVQIELEARDIFVTTSSACSDNDPTPSKVLKAMNIPDDVGRGVIRISLGMDRAADYYSQIYHHLCYTYEKLLKIGPLRPAASRS